MRKKLAEVVKNLPLRQMQIQLSKIFVRVRARFSNVTGLLVITLLPFAFLLILTDLGSYLEYNLALKPYFKLSYQLNAHHKLDKDIRLIIVDDRTLGTIGRFPTFSEWQQIAEKLFTLGFDTVLLNDNFTFDFNVGETAVNRSKNGFFGIAAVDYPNLKNPLAVKALDLPSDNFLKSEDTLSRRFPMSRYLLSSTPKVIATADVIGEINMLRDSRTTAFMPVAIM